MKLTISDFVQIPRVKPLPYDVLWVLYLIITCVPGALLWLCTLGAFRYFHLTDMVMNYLIEKDLGYYDK